MSASETLADIIIRNDISQLKIFIAAHEELKKENKDIEDVFNSTIIFNKKETTPLILATTQDSPDLISLLIKAGSKINIGTKDCFPPIHLAIVDRKDKSLASLMEHKADINLIFGNVTPLLRAIGVENLFAAELLIRSKADVNIPRTTDNISPFYLAADLGLVTICELLIEEKADLNTRYKTDDCSDGQTALFGSVIKHGLCKENEMEKKEVYLKIIKIIIDSGIADINIRRRYDGLNAIFLAAHMNNLEVFKILLLAGSNIHIRWKHSETLELYAIKRNLPAIVSILRDFEYRGPLTPEWLIAIIEKNDISGLKKFIARHQQEKLENKEVHDIFNSVIFVGDGEATPLIVAALTDNPELISILIDAGARVDMGTKDCRHVLHLAAARGRNNSLKKFLELGANVNAIGTYATPIFSSIFENNIIALQLLIRSRANVNVVHVGDNISPLYLAVTRGLFSFCELLVEAKANLSIRIKANDIRNGQTALMESVIQYSSARKNEIDKKEALIKIIQLIVSSGRANLNIRRHSDGATAIFLAAHTNSPEIFKILLAAGARIDIPLHTGESLEDRVINRNILDILSILEGLKSKPQMKVEKIVPKSQQEDDKNHELETVLTDEEHNEMKALKNLFFCSLSNKPLKSPIVSTCCGSIFNNESINDGVNLQLEECPKCQAKSSSCISLPAVCNVIECLSPPKKENIVINYMSVNTIRYLMNFIREKMPSINSELTCPITDLICFNPVASKVCGHVYEENAILQFLNTKNICPCCKMPLTSRDLFKLSFLTNAVSVLEKYGYGSSEEESQFDSLECKENFESSPLFQEELNAEIIDLEKQLLCPISKSPISSVVQSVSCGHIYDKENIRKYIEEEKSECPHENCNKTINKIISIPVLSNVLYLLTATKSSLIEKGYQTIDLARSLRELDESKLSEVEAEITCPITNQIMFQPFITTNCGEDNIVGHSFESISMDAWAEPHRNCPCCRQDIATRNEMTTSPILTKLIDLLVFNKPALAQKQFFSLEVLSGVVESWDERDLPRIVRLLFLFPPLLNNPTQEGKNKGSSALGLLTFRPNGIRLLTQNPFLLGKITDAGLNTVFSSGPSKGMSPAFSLMYTKEGRALLANNFNLQNKISSEALCHRSSITNTSAVFSLSCDEDGHSILANNHVLRGKVTASALNEVCSAGHFYGLSPLYLLIRKQIGSDLIFKDEVLRRKIYPESLAVGPKVGNLPDKYTNVLIQILDRPNGAQLIADDLILRRKITSEALNYVVPEGPYKGISALFLLLRKTIGFNTLFNDLELARKIDPKTLQTICESDLFDTGVSPFCLLTGTDEGLNFLDQHPELYENVSQETFNAIIKKGPSKGTSPLFWILCKDINFLVKHPALIEKIQSPTLSTVSESRFSHIGFTPLVILAISEIGIKLLAEHSALREKISVSALNYICRTGEYRGVSPVFGLLKSAAGCQLLENDPVLCDKINSETLYVVSESVHKDIAPIIFLTGMPFGRKLLFKSPSLRKKILLDNLLIKCNEKFNKDKSPLDFLLQTKDGHEVLELLLDENSLVPDWRLRVGLKAGQQMGEVEFKKFLELQKIEESIRIKPNNENNYEGNLVSSIGEVEGKSSDSICKSSSVSSPITALGNIYRQMCKRFYLAASENPEQIKPFMDAILEKRFSTALRRACTGSGELPLELIKILFEYKEYFSFDVNEQVGNDKRAAIHHAAIKGNTHIYNFLIEKGANANLLDFGGFTAAHYLAESQKSKSLTTSFLT